MAEDRGMKTFLEIVVTTLSGLSCANVAQICAANLNEEEIKHTQICFNFYLLYNDILKERFFKFTFTVPSEAPAFDVIVVNSTAVNVSWQVVTRRCIYFRMILFFFNIDMSYLFPLHILHPEGKYFKPKLLVHITGFFYYSAKR